MYRQHNPQIARAMRADLHAFERGFWFVLASIRQQFPRVPEQLEEIAREGDQASCLFNFKRKAFLYMRVHAADLHSRILAARTNARRLEIACEVPGLGIVKAAFLLQLMGYNVACLDSRNIKREGRDPRVYRTDGKPAHKLRKKIAQYVVDTGGRAREYWDAWCKDVASTYDMEPYEVSALHLAIIPRTEIPF